MFAIVVKFVDGGIQYYGPFSGIHKCNAFGYNVVNSIPGAYAFHSVRMTAPENVAVTWRAENA